MRCAGCQFDNPLDARFCASCGARLPSSCTECGAASLPGARFCTQCGSSLGGEAHGGNAAKQTARAPGDAERRQLTVLFCDMVGSTALSTRLDPEELGDLNRAYRAMCRRIVESYDGYVARHMGDGLLCYFGYPRAHEDDPARAAHAGIELAAKVGELGVAGVAVGSLAARVGIATGPVVVGELIGEGASREHDVVGETPNLAARLQGLAQPGSVVVSDATRNLLGSAFRIESLGTHTLKGFDAPLPAWRVTGSAARETRFDARVGAELTPFTGREHECALVSDRWEQACRGAGGVVLLSGEAGIGKSRMAGQLRGRIVAGDHVSVRCQCSPYHRQSALHPIIEHLQRAAGLDRDAPAEQQFARLEELLGRAGADDDLELIAALLGVLPEGRSSLAGIDADVLRDRTLEALARSLESLSGRGPLFILIEDIHWADPTTLDFIALLVERLIDWRALMVLTFRPEFAPPWTGEAHVTLVSLSRLDRQQCEAIIGNLTGGKTLPEEVVARIAEKTDGVPLFVEELTRTVIDSGLLKQGETDYQLVGPLTDLAIPETLQDSLMARLDTLDDAKSIAQIGAAIGREFSRPLLLAVAGCTDEEVEAAVSRLVESNLLYRRGAGSGTRFVFKHALVRDAAYASMLRSRRVALHQRIARAIERDFPDAAEAQPELLAQHFLAAGANGEALEYWSMAGRRAMQAGASREAISHFEQALECLEGLDDSVEHADRTIELRLAIADCMRVVDRIESAFEVLASARETAERHGLTRQLSRIHFQRGNLYFPLARADECLVEHQRALQFAQSAGSTPDEVRALGGLGDASYVGGRLRTARDYFAQCVEISRRHGYETTAVANLSMVGFSRAFLLELREALQDGVEAEKLAIAAGHPRAELLALILQSQTFYYMGRYTEAIRGCEKADALAERLGAQRFQPQNIHYRAMSHYYLGNKEAASELVDVAEKAARRSSVQFTLARVLGGVALTASDEDRRARALAESERLLDQGVVSHNYFGFCLLASDACFDRGDWSGMAHYADRLEAYTKQEPLPWSNFVVSRARALSRWGRGERSSEVTDTLERLHALGVEHEFRNPLGRIELALG